MRGLGALVVLCLAGGVLTGCHGTSAIPAGAQQVHVSDTESTLRVEPATVRAGDVYVVLDGPRQSVVLVSRKRTAEETPGPMSDDDLNRLALGDTKWTSIEGFSVGCSAQQQAESRGRMGHCGNVYKLVLGAGRYAFLLDSPDSDPPRPVPAGSMAVLEVSP